MTDYVVLTFVALLAVLASLRRERILDVLLGLEDPRPLARFRVALAVLLAMNVFSMHQSAEFLFSNAGLFTTEGGRFAMARAQFDDFVTPGLWTLLKYPAGTRWSLLHFWDAPWVVHLHFVVLYVACLGLALGKWTTLAKWTALVAYNTLWSRNILVWGGEQIMMIALLLLCLSDCGAACSLDARGRPLRPVPRWPRVLLLLQLLPTYLGNALAKDGGTWIQGHAVHFTTTSSAHGRLPLVVEHAAELAPLFWLATHLTLYLEFGFALLVVRTLAAIPGPRRPATPAIRVVVAAASGLAGAIFVHEYEPIVQLGVPEVVGLVGGIAVAVIVRRLLATRLGARVFSCISAPRLWIPMGLLFHVGVFVTMSVDVFVLATAAYYLLLTGGDPALERPRATLPEVRALETRDVLGFLAASFIVLAFAPGLWGPMLVACVLAVILRARARGVPRRQLLVPAYCVFHVAGALLWAMPRERPVTAARVAASKPLHEWIEFTKTFQSWRMFAPNVSRREGFLTALGYDEDGRASVIYQSPATPTASERPLLGREKREKILRRISNADDPWTHPWFARSLCQRAAPEIREVVLAQRTYELAPFGTSETIAERRRRFEREAAYSELSSHSCPSTGSGDGLEILTVADRRRGTPSRTPWHLVAIALWLVGWFVLPAAPGSGARRQAP